MAIRLAISTIASEKARYKEAIMNWLLGIVMLFTMHFILSFVFYTNEQMVKIASNVLTTAIKNAGINFDFTELSNSVLSPEDRLKNYCETNNITQTLTDDKKKIAGYLISDSEYIAMRLPNSLDPNDANATAAFNSNLLDAFGIFDALGRHYNYAFNYNDTAVITDKYSTLNEDAAWARVVYDAKITGRLNLDSPEKFKETVLKLTDERTFEYSNSSFWGLFNTTTTTFKGTYPQYLFSRIGTNVLANFMLSLNANLNNTSFEEEFFNRFLESAYDYTKMLYNAAAKANGKNLSGSAVDIISGMGNYFKTTAFVYTSETTSSGDTTITGWRATKITLTGALLYAIFIVQSLMYFIQYIKRFFYIIILSLIGPAVVIYDFVTKSIK